MAEASWSRCGDEECIRISGIGSGAHVRVRPGPAEKPAGRFPAMAGHVVPDGSDLCFCPRFPFMDGTSYQVFIDGVAVAALLRPERHIPATTEVLSIHPSTHEVPRNLLRVYVVFSQPMSEGYAAEHLTLLDRSGEILRGALFATDYELWDGGHRRLTALLDPARIKRGLVPQHEAGYPIRSGEPVRLVVGQGFRDARGAPLRAGAERQYEVGADERRRVDPATWELRAPRRNSLETLEVTFDRPLDYGLVSRCLRAVGPTGRPVIGSVELGPAEQSWRLVPSVPWLPGRHELVVDDILEDVAGNSVRRVFDRDRTRSSDAVRETGPFVMDYFPR